MRRPFHGGARASWTTWARILGLVVLVAGFVDLTSALFPQRSDMPDLIADVRQGRADRVQVYYVDGAVAGARWSTGWGRRKQLTQPVPSRPSPEGTALTHLLRYRLGADADKVTVVREPPMRGLGGLSLFVPILYWRLIPHTVVKWAVALVCALIVAHVLWREDDLRAPNAGCWLFACVVLGVGFPAYVWSEPTPLATLRPPGPAGAAMSGLRLTGVVSLWSSAALTTWLLWP
jgi:hypothetical protein